MTEGLIRLGFIHTEIKERMKIGTPFTTCVCFPSRNLNLQRIPLNKVIQEKIPHTPVSTKHLPHLENKLCLQAMREMKQWPLTLESPEENPKQRSVL